jgi:putative transcriptional regulator
VRTGFRLHRRATGALCAFLLLLGTFSSAPADDEKPLTAILLVARPELPDPNFEDSVVLVMNNLGPVPAGVIINRPMKMGVSRLFPDLQRLEQLPDTVYFGGPVDFGTVWFLFRADTPPEHAVKAFNGVCLSASEDLLRELLGRDKPMEGLRIFIGHSGWAPGQLETEVAHGDWTLAPASADAIFNRKSEHPWPAEEDPDAGHGI